MIEPPPEVGGLAAPLSVNGGGSVVPWYPSRAMAARSWRQAVKAQDIARRGVAWHALVQDVRRAMHDWRSTRFAFSMSVSCRVFTWRCCNTAGLPTSRINRQNPTIQPTREPLKEQINISHTFLPHALFHPVSECLFQSCLTQNMHSK